MRKRNAGRRVLIVPAIMGFSVLFGFLRELLLAWFYGSSRDIEIFRLAYSLPALFSDVAAGSLIALILNRLGSRSYGSALQQTTWFAILFAFGMTFLGVAAMPALAYLLGPGLPEQDHRTLVDTGRICWLMFGITFVTLPLRAAMVHHGKIIPSAANALVRNFMFIPFFMLSLAIVRQINAFTASLTVLLASIAILVFNLVTGSKPILARCASFVNKRPDSLFIRSMMLAAITILLTQFLITSGRTIDRAVASYHPEGTLAALEYSYAIIMAIGQLIGTSSNIMLAPILARSIRRSGRVEKTHYRTIIRLVVASFIVSLPMALASDGIIELIYERGAFGSAASAATSNIFRAQILGLAPMIASLLCTQLIIQLGRHNMVAIFSAGKLLIKIASLVILARYLDICAALGLSFVVTEIAMTLMLLTFLMKDARSRGGPPPENAPVASEF